MCAPGAQSGRRRPSGRSSTNSTTLEERFQRSTTNNWSLLSPEATSSLPMVLAELRSGCEYCEANHLNCRVEFPIIGNPGERMPKQHPDTPASVLGRHLRLLDTF